MKEFVIYTVMVGGYDEIRQPLVVDDRFDYVLFSDQHIGEKNGVWEVRTIDFSTDSRLKLSRYPKCLPHRLLNEYKASLYIDANLQILIDIVYSRFFQMMENDIEWGGIKYPDDWCDDVYECMNVILDLRWVHDYDTIRWYAYLKHNKFPEHTGLYENNVIFRQHTENVMKVNEEWWKSLETECKRDQFSLMYFLWKYQPKTAYLLDEKECPRTNSTNFAYYAHQPHKRIIDCGFHETLREKLLTIVNPNENKYRWLFDKLSRFSYPLLMLYIWEGYACFMYGWKIAIRIIKRKCSACPILRHA